LQLLFPIRFANVVLNKTRAGNKVADHAAKSGSNDLFQLNDAGRTKAPVPFIFHIADGFEMRRESPAIFDVWQWKLPSLSFFPFIFPIVFFGVSFGRLWV